LIPVGVSHTLEKNNEIRTYWLDRGEPSYGNGQRRSCAGFHKESADGNSSKTVVKDDNGKTVTKRHGANMKKVHTDPNGDKTVVKKTVE